MANIASLFRRFYAFIVGLALFHSFGNASFAQTVTQKSAVTLSKNSKLVQSQAGFYRMTIGDINVTALSDGTVGLQILDGLLLNAKSGEVQKLLAHNYQKSPINASINAFLIQLSGRLILIDAGSAELVGPTANKLPDSLRAVGVQPEQITDIFLTHIHPDHSGGLMEGNKKVFPNAIIHVDKREVEYWFDESIAAMTAEPIKTFFSQVDAKVKPYLDSGQLQTFEGATEFFPGFRSQPAYGHTPGHSLYVLESAGEKLVFCGDLVHVDAVQFDDPSVSIKFDSDPAKAAEQRKKTFADAATNRYLLAFAHVSFPGVGQVRKEGDRYRWIPVEYMNDALKQEPRQSQGEKNMQTNEKQKAVSLLKSLETGDRKPLVYINPNEYIQHNPNVETGLQGLKELFGRLPPNVKVNTVRAFQDSSFVFVHSEYNFSGPKVGFDIFRFVDGMIVEHWENLQEELEKPNASGHTMIDGPTEATDVEKTDANKQLVRSFVEDIFVNIDLDKFGNYFDGDNYIQHNPHRTDGASALGDKLREAALRGTPLKFDKIHRVLGEGNFVLSISEGQFAGKHAAFYDLWRVENGKIAEHWDVVEEVPAKSDPKNINGKFWNWNSAS